MRFSGVIMAALLLLAGCTVRPATYVAPAADQNAAAIAVGKLTESYSVSEGSSWISIIAVDGEPTGLAPAVLVTPGQHRITVRHWDPYATFYGNIRHESVTFQAAAGGQYRIDADYCCGFILGRLQLFVVDASTGQQVAAAE
jgi:hypothetical protein